MLGRPLLVPLAEMQKKRRLGHNHKPDNWFVAEMDDVSIMVLLFDRYVIVGAFIDKSGCLQGGCRPGTSRAFMYSCDNSVIRERLEQAAEICFFDWEATRSTVRHLFSPQVSMLQHPSVLVNRRL
jgi:hypothetical protein